MPREGERVGVPMRVRGWVCRVSERVGVPREGERVGVPREGERVSVPRE